MRKSEMTTEQLNTVDLIYKTMIGAKWKGRETNKLFTNGLFIPQEAVFDYHNTNCEIIILFSFEKGNFDIIIQDSMFDTKKRVNLVVHINKPINNLLDLITSYQDVLSFENYKEFISEIGKLFPEDTYLFQNNSLYKLTK